MNPDELNDADYWEHLVQSGKSEQMATASVLQRRNQQKPAVKPAPAISKLGITAPLAKGATLNFADEILGGIDAANSLLPKALGGKGAPFSDLNKNYEIGRQKVNDVTSQYSRENPKTALVAELAGGIAPALIPGARGLGLIKGGAAYGAVAGAGNAKGGLGSRVGGTIGGAVTGAATGGALKVAGNVGRVGYDAVKAGAKSLLGKTARPVTATVPEASAPIVERAKDLLPRTPKDRASGVMLDALKKDKRTPQNILDLLDATQKPRALGDLSGENTLGVQRWARGTPSEAKTEIPRELYQRQAGMQERLVDDASELAGGIERQNIPKSIETMGASRDAQAGQLFGELRTRPPIDASALKEHLTTPAGQAAIKQAERVALNERKPFPPIFDEAGNMRPLDFETVHNLKLAFDDLLGTSPATPLESGGLGKNNARVIKNLKNDFLQYADEMFPGYGKARDAFAEPSAVMRAMEDGRNFFKMPIDEAALTMEKLSAPEKEGLIKGALNALADRIETGMKTFDQTRRVILPTQEQKRLRLLFPDDESFHQFLGRAEEEAAMRHSLNVTESGSQSWEKFNQAANIEGQIDPGIMGDLMQGRFGSALGKTWNRGQGFIQKGINEETANELSPMLTAGMKGDRQNLIAIIKQLQEAQARESSRMMTRNIASRPLTSMSGGAVGGGR